MAGLRRQETSLDRWCPLLARAGTCTHATVLVSGRSANRLASLWLESGNNPLTMHRSIVWLEQTFVLGKSVYLIYFKDPVRGGHLEGVQAN